MTEVPGRQQRTRTEIHCQPCSSGRDVVQADGYCQTCREYLCTICFKCHGRQKLTRNHVLHDKSNMPINVSPLEHDLLCTELCKKHEDKSIEFYCTSSDCANKGGLICSVCKTIDHTNCKVSYLPEVAKHYKETEEYTFMLRCMGAIDERIDKYEKQVDVNLKEADDIYQTALNDIDTFRDEMTAYIDKGVQELRVKAQQQKKDAVKLMENVKEDCHKVGKDTRDLRSKALQDENLVQIFSTAKRLIPQIKSMQDKCGAIPAGLQIRRYRFHPAKEIQEMISSRKPLGQILQMAGMNLTKHSEISVHSGNDRSWPDITGMAFLSDDTVLLADMRNRSIKKVNITTQSIQSTLKLPGQTHDVACISNDQAAVTMPVEQMILIISTSGAMSVIRKVKVRGKCWGVCYTDSNTLVVTYNNPSKVEILNTSAEVLQTFTPRDQHGNPLLQCPQYVNTMRTWDQAYIYISDCDTKTITKLSMTGQVICQYNELSLSPHGIMCLPGDQFVVSNGLGDGIVLLHDVGAQMRKVKEWSCVKCPWALVLSPKTDKLCVCSYTALGDMLHVYKFTALTL